MAVWYHWADMPVLSWSGPCRPEEAFGGCWRDHFSGLQLEVRGEKSSPLRSFPTSVEIVYSILYYMIYIYIDMIWYDMIWYENRSHKPPRKGSAQARPLERNIQLTAALAASLVSVADCWLYFQWLSGFRMFRTSFSPVESLQKWLWVNTEKNTIFSGLFTSILTQLFWCEQKGYYWFWISTKVS